MTFISRKTRLLVPRWLDENDPSYRYQLNRKRSDGRLKRHSSCDDLRAWVDDEYLNYQHLLELMTNEGGRPMLGIMGRFIPIEDIIEMVCNDMQDSVGEDSDCRVARMERKPGNHELTADDIIKVTNAAMEKLEKINRIIGGVSSDDIARECIQRSRADMLENDSSGSGNRDDYANEYDKVFQKITCLQKKLTAIQQCREKLNLKMKKATSPTSVKELYNREGQARERKMQKKVEKLIAEKGQVLREMCQAVKHLNELRKKINCISSDSARGRSSSNQGSYYRYPAVDRGKESYSSSASPCCSKSGKRSSGSGVSFCCGPLARSSSLHNAVDSAKREKNLYSSCSQRTFSSGESGRRMDQQYRYRGRNEPIPDGRFKPRTTMTEVEQALRSYEQRLKEFGKLEEQIENLRKNASLANYFKKRWLKCTARGRNQRAVEKDKMSQEMTKICTENKNLKCVIRQMTAKSDKEHTELQLLRFNQRQMAEKEMEMVELRKKLGGYELSCQKQRQSIMRLEETICVQREEIEKLMNHVLKLRKDAGRTRDCGQRMGTVRSRSYGPERARKTTSSDEDGQHVCCPGCSIYNYNNQTARPRSECNRRYKERESYVRQQMSRRPNCCNYILVHPSSSECNSRGDALEYADGSTGQQQDFPSFPRRVERVPDLERSSSGLEATLWECTESIGTTLADIFLLLQSFFSFLFQCNYSYVEEEDYTEEKEDWSSILIFIMIVKCRTSIGKILDADDDE